MGAECAPNGGRFHDFFRNTDCNGIYRESFFCGAICCALSPVNRRDGDPFPRFLISLCRTFRPNGFICFRESQCTKILETLLRSLLMILRSSHAEDPSKSPASFRCRLSFLRCTNILKLDAMVLSLSHFFTRFNKKNHLRDAGSVVMSGIENILALISCDSALGFIFDIFRSSRP